MKWIVKLESEKYRAYHSFDEASTATSFARVAIASMECEDPEKLKEYAKAEIFCEIEKEEPHEHVQDAE